MAEPNPIQPTAAPASLVEFVISNMMIETLVTTYQYASQPGVICAWRTLRDYNYIWSDAGTAVWEFEDQQVTINPGDLVLVPKGHAHRGLVEKPQLALGSIHVLPTLPGGGDVFDLLKLPLHRHAAEGSRLRQYLQGAAAEWDRPEPAHTRQMLTAWARLITIELIRHDHAAGTLQALPIDPLVHEVLDYLNRSLDQPLTLGNLADWSGFSPQHLNRTFKKVLGLTPLQYFMHMRLERASQLLTDGRWTVASVANQVGYSDPYYFSRLFKQHFGVAPAHWREHGAEGSEKPGSDNPS